MTIDDTKRDERSDASAPSRDPSEEKTPFSLQSTPLSTPKPLSTPASPLSVPKVLATPNASASVIGHEPTSHGSASKSVLSQPDRMDPCQRPDGQVEELPPIPGHWTERLPDPNATSATGPVKKRRRRRRRHVGPRDEVLVELRRFFHIQNFRPKQRDVIAAILDGKDTVAIMPTGSGKSLTYQMAARVMPGLTIVISPLIALLRDQHEKLLKYGLDGVRFDSSLTPKQREKTIAELEAGKHKILLITPESIVAEDFRSRIAERDVSLLVIDEAHCVSQWGHDFRPSYLSLNKVAEDLGEPPILALTATATPKVQEDIIHQLGMEDPVRIVAPPDRPNLSFSVELHDSEMTKLRSILHHVRVLPRPGIIYCATTRDVEMVWAMLRKARIQAEYYHGKLLKSERDAAHSAFMSGRNPLVMVATNAFGLGVDKPNIRYVLHYQVPGSLEAYVQEAGRAGRDGKPSRCILLYDEKDLEIQEYFLEQQYPTRSQVRHVAEALAAWSERGEPVTLRDLALSAHTPQTRTSVVLRLLQDLSFASEVEMGKALTLTAPPKMEEVERAAAIYDVQRVHDRRRLSDLTSYATTTECRNSFIQRYFGAEDALICGHCDNDMAPEDRAQLDRETRTVMETPVTLKKKRRKERHGSKKKKARPTTPIEAKPQPSTHLDEGEPSRKKRRRRRKKKHTGTTQHQNMATPVPTTGASPATASAVVAPAPSLSPRSSLPRNMPPRATEESSRTPRYAAPLDGSEPPSRHRRRRHRGGRTIESPSSASDSMSAIARPSPRDEAPSSNAVAMTPHSTKEHQEKSTVMLPSPPVVAISPVSSNAKAPEMKAAAPVTPPAPSAEMIARAHEPNVSRLPRKSKKAMADKSTLPEPFARAAENLRTILAATEDSRSAEVPPSPKRPARKIKTTLTASEETHGANAAVDEAKRPSVRTTSKTVASTTHAAISKKTKSLGD